MIQKTLFTFFSFFLLIAVSGCAPGLGSNLKVGVSEESEISSFRQSVIGSEVKAHVLKFTDVRLIDSIAQIDGRLVKTDSDVGSVAQLSFEGYLRANGVKLTLFNSPTIRGSVREWRVFVTPGFPSSKLIANASIGIEVVDLKDRVVHKGIYGGNYEEEHPFLSDSKVKASLGKAMGYAIAEAISDPEFINKLTTIQGSREEIPMEDDSLEDSLQDNPNSQY